MKKGIVLPALIVLLIGWSAAPAIAADVTAAVDINSAYVWRGQTFNDGLVIQPSVDVAQGGFGFNVWGNIDVDDYDNSLDEGEFSEVDLTLSYGATFGIVDVGIGWIEYLFPTTDMGGAPGTREFYVSLGTALPAGFSVSLDYYYDFDEVEEFYTVLGLSYSYEINDKTSIEAGGSVAYAGDEYCGDANAGFYDYSLSFSLGYAITDAVSLGVSLVYVDAINDDNLVDIDEGGPLDVKTYGGASISYAF